MAKNIEFYLEKTLSENPLDVAHLLKYLYFPYIRFDGKYWYHFLNHRWIVSEKEVCPLVPLLKNEISNRYLALASEYNNRCIQKNHILCGFPDEDPEKMNEYYPLIISDLINKSRLCSEMSQKLCSTSYYQKILECSQELFTTRDFEYSMDRNPYLIGFNNGIYHLEKHSFDIATHNSRVLMSVGYDYRSDDLFKEAVVDFWNKLGLTSMLPCLASLLSGMRRQPLICISNLNETSQYAIEQLLQWTLGDYLGRLPFAELRKRKIPSSASHTHNELIENCKKRLVLVEQAVDDHLNVSADMVDTLLTATSLSLRKPHENNKEYQPQFGIVVLSQKKDIDSLSGALLFKANDVPDGELVIKEEWKLDCMKMLFGFLREVK